VPPAVVEFATTAQRHHRDHAAAWNAVLTRSDKQAVTGVDVTVKAQVDQQFSQVKDVAGLARLALELEDVAAATYLAAIDAVKSPAGIKTAATIEPVELQHSAILNFVLGQYPVPNSFTPLTGARPVSDKIG
jgi:Ferritin-like domain